MSKAAHAAAITAGISPFMPAQQTASGLPWVPRFGDERSALAIAQQHGVSELVASILAGRGVTIDDVPRFLAPSLRDYLPDPFHLKDMEKAVARLMYAINEQEPIAVFGDYDVDGATSTALLWQYFSQLGVALRTYIPDRMKEGYGPTVEAFKKLIGQGAKLIITVDCGTLAHEPIAYAQSKGVDVLVLDHHLSSGALPNAHAIVNPNRVDESSTHRQLAAVGVTFLMLVALNKSLREAGFFATRTEPNLLNMLDLVALGTVCDVMPLTGLNRALVMQGLKVLKARQQPGLAALADVARLDSEPNVYHLGFLLGPRINAGGRVGEAGLGVALLTSADEGERRAIALKLDQLNTERQGIEETVTAQVRVLAAQQENAPVIVVASEGWHAGVIGIVAGRLKEQYARPVAVIALADGVGKGSARSVPGADLGAAIHAAHTQGILESGGGHAMAAGFNLRAEAVSDLQEFLIARLSSAVAAYNDARVMKLDGWLSVGGANLPLLDDISKAGPFGLGNPAPRFAIKSARILHRDVMKGVHIRCVVGDDAGTGRLNAVAFKAIGSKLGQWLMEERVLDLAGELKRNSWQGNESAQFIVEDAAKPA